MGNAESCKQLCGKAIIINNVECKFLFKLVNKEMVLFLSDNLDLHCYEIANQTHTGVIFWDFELKDENLVFFSSELIAEKNVTMKSEVTITVKRGQYTDMKQDQQCLQQHKNLLKLENDNVKKYLNVIDYLSSTT